MTYFDYPKIGEGYYEERLPDGLLVRVVKKPGFARKYAFLAVDFGSIDTKFTLDGKTLRVPDGIAHYLEHKMFDLPDGNAMNLFAAHGGSPNAFTSYAMTAYYRLLAGKTSLYDMTDVIDMGGVEKSVPVETTPNSLAVAGTVETSQHDEVWTLLLGLSVGILFGIVLGIGLSAVVVVMYVKMKKRFDK